MTELLATQRNAPYKQVKQQAVISSADLASETSEFVQSITSGFHGQLDVARVLQQGMHATQAFEQVEGQRDAS